MKWNLVGGSSFAMLPAQGSMSCGWLFPAERARGKAMLSQEIESKAARAQRKFRRRELNPGLPRDRQKY